jgi:hypothetical protein
VKLMRHTRVNAALTGLLVLMLASAAAKTPAPISLRIATSVNPVKVGKPVKVVVTVKNETQEPIAIAGGTAEEIYKVDVRDNVGNPIPERDRIRIRTLGELKLDPGESHQDEIVLSHMYDMSRPGTYLVVVGRVSRYEPEAGTENVRSNLLVINITK